jgi:hypothetical protein
VKNPNPPSITGSDNDDHKVVPIIITTTTTTTIIEREFGLLNLS